MAAGLPPAGGHGIETDGRLILVTAPPHSSFQVHSRQQAEGNRSRQAGTKPVTSLSLSSMMNPLTHQGHTMSGLQFSARQFPQHPVEWLHEIADAYRDAHDTLPFMPLVGVMPSVNKLFHLAPRVAVKFRGLPLSRVDAATEAALSSYVASQEQAGGAFDDPRLAFAFCYLASHFGLDLISEECVDEVMSFLEENQPRLAELAGRAG
jgi:hypothetical protein